MRRLYIKLVLWLNGYCTKHGILKTHNTQGFCTRCSLCAREELGRPRTECKAHDTYLDKLLEEFNR